MLVKRVYGYGQPSIRARLKGRAKGQHKMCYLQPKSRNPMLHAEVIPTISGLPRSSFILQILVDVLTDAEAQVRYHYLERAVKVKRELQSIRGEKKTTRLSKRYKIQLNTTAQVSTAAK